MGNALAGEGFVGKEIEGFEASQWDSGVSLDLNDFAGGIVVLDFFAYWCVPCLGASAELEKYVQQFYDTTTGNSAGQSVRVISINVESDHPDKTAAFLRRTGASLVLNDTDGEIFKRFEGRGLPFIVILDGTSINNHSREWKVAYRNAGYEGYTEIREIIDSLGHKGETLSEIGSPTFPFILSQQQKEAATHTGKMSGGADFISTNTADGSSFISAGDEDKYNIGAATADPLVQNTIPVATPTLADSVISEMATPPAIRILNDNLEFNSELVLSSDIKMYRTGITYQRDRGVSSWGIDFSADRIDIDYQPNPDADVIGKPAKLTEYAGTFQINRTRMFSDSLEWQGSAGGYKGFTSHRSLWLEEYYRQQFSKLEGYVESDPWGFNLSSGLRWEYSPTTGFIQANLVFQQDDVAPGFDKPLFEPLERGRERLHTGAAVFTFENVLTRKLRSLLQVSLTGTTDRELRYSYQGSFNYALSENWVLRTVFSATQEDDEEFSEEDFFSWSAEGLIERDWDSRYFLNFFGRYYEDSGQIETSILISSGPPPLTTYQIGGAFRWQGRTSAFKAMISAYRTRFGSPDSDILPFANLYQNRNWVMASVSFSKLF